MMIGSMLLGIALVSQAASGQSSEPQAGSSYAGLLKTGTAAVARGELAAGKADLQTAAALDPGNPAAWYELGVLAGQTGDFRTAENLLRHTLSLAPELAKAHYLLGMALVGDPPSKLDWPGAIAEFRSALRLQPRYPEVLVHLAAGLNATGQNDAAISALLQAVDQNPASSSAFFSLGLALENAQKVPEAIDAYRKALALKPVYPEAGSALGKLLLRSGQTADAEAALRAALRANPDLQDAHYTLGRVLRQIGLAEQAKVELDQASALGQREPLAVESTQLSNSALQMAAAGRLSDAEQALRRAIRLHPDYGVPHYNLGLILADTGKLDAADMELRVSISLLPGRSKPWFDLGRVQLLEGRSSAARQSFQWAARLDPGDARVREQLRAATPPVTADPPPEAESATDPAKASSDTAARHAAFADELEAKKNDPGAAGERLRSLALEPGAVPVRLALAATYERLGDTAAALREYRKVLLVVPEDVAAQQAVRRLVVGTTLPNRTSPAP